MIRILVCDDIRKKFEQFQLLEKLKSQIDERHIEDIGSISAVSLTDNNELVYYTLSDDGSENWSSFENLINGHEISSGDKCFVLFDQAWRSNEDKRDSVIEKISNRVDEYYFLIYTTQTCAIEVKEIISDLRRRYSIKEDFFCERCLNFPSHDAGFRFFARKAIDILCSWIAHNASNG